MDLAALVGYCAASLVFLTFAMKTMIPLRIVGLASNVFFIAYGYLDNAYPVLFLHIVLLPLNAWRLHQMLDLVKQVSEAARGDLNLDWLKSFSRRRRVKAGEVLYRKNDPAESMAFLLSGRFRIEALRLDLAPGQMIGEMGMMAPARTRTQTVVCVEEGDILEIGYDQLKQLYFQNPKFGFYFLQLTTRRLFENIAALEKRLAAAELQLAEAK
jgi:CRP/FNR family cyclic AMP-dependent transcriptional regulator